LSFGKVPNQVVQLAVVFAVVGVSMVLIRQRFVPESFGELGHYRADSVDQIAALEIQYAGWQVCADCHEEEVETKNQSYHRTLSCEVCHGAAWDHADEQTDETPILPKQRSLCLQCHSYLSSRPTGFPQIVEERHEPARPCHTCHDPHDPAPSERPESCSACHAAISRVKSVSHHAPLDCTVCHETPEEHSVLPRSHLPRKPFQREFCGTCHADGAEASDIPEGVDLAGYEIPRVDLVTHGGTLVCWQCHYQHSPEAR
jgi:hypothetical protein